MAQPVEYQERLNRFELWLNPLMSDRAPREEECGATVASLRRRGVRRNRVLFLCGSIVLIVLCIFVSIRGQSASFQIVGEALHRALRDHNKEGGVLSPTSRIVGGNSADNGEYPFMVALYWGTLNGDKPVCGGTLITPNIVVTAAHCVFSVTSLEIGRHDVRDDSGVTSYRIKWANKRAHEGYDSGTNDNDIALIQLPNRHPNAETATIDRTRSVNQWLTAIGWGTLATSGPQPDVLMEVDLKYFSDASCKARYGDEFNPTNMICASEEEKDSCQGDSGGPLLEMGTSTLVGITSWGYECASNYYPGVYARVSTYAEWIDKVVCIELSPGDCINGRVANSFQEPTPSTTGEPSASPSKQPSSKPSASPSGIPTLVHSTVPSSEPSASPSGMPTVVHSSVPSNTLQPSLSPTYMHSETPSATPSEFPSHVPTIATSKPPSASPSTMPSDDPSKPPSASPSTMPSDDPSKPPSASPSTMPSDDPSKPPSASPSTMPSDDPSKPPSASPSTMPSDDPSKPPSVSPSTMPSDDPSKPPSASPSTMPSDDPSKPPSASPNTMPSDDPSKPPSASPNSMPSDDPSETPIFVPSFGPTTMGSKSPTASFQPSNIPHTEIVVKTPSQVAIDKQLASCQDRERFLVGNIVRNCEWVNVRKDRRCLSYKRYCPQTCEVPGCV